MLNSHARATRRLTQLVGRRASVGYRFSGPVVAGWLAVYAPSPCVERWSCRWLAMSGRARFRWTPPRAWSAACETLTPSELDQLTQEFWRSSCQ